MKYDIFCKILNNFGKTNFNFNNIKYKNKNKLIRYRKNIN